MKKSRSYRPLKKEQMIKELDLAINEMKNNSVIVEGKKDKASLEKVGIQSIPAAGKFRKVCEEIKGGKVIILTDFDRKVDQLAAMLMEELWANGKKPNLEIRKKIRRILRVKYFEEFNKKYEEFKKMR